MIVDLISSLAGFIIPPAVDFIKKKFLKTSDTPEATLSALATTKPEVLAQYVSAQASLLESQTKYYNRDVIGEASRWVIDLRASIRPIFTIISILIVFLALPNGWQLDASFKALMEVTISSWFGSRLV